MSKKVIGVGAILLAGALVATLVMTWALPGTAEAARGGWQGNSRGSGQQASAPLAQQANLVVSGDLSEAEEEALLMALEDEYKAWSVYDQVIADFGAVRPFTSIQASEESHIAALVTLFERYGLDVPENEWAGTIPSFDSLSEACATGAQAEIDNAALYDELFSMVDNADILRVFSSLQWASENRHLPVFESCAG